MIENRKRLLLLILWTGLLSSPIVAKVDLLQRLGVTPTQIKSKNFSLNFVKGGDGQLRDYRGKWVLLNFWATWCGPCRKEMPTLESVAQEFQGDNLQVLGVSVDQGPVGLVKKYLKETGITFPNFHDVKSEVSLIYQATAIPSVYIISPDGYLAGVFRGGKSWETDEVLQILKELVAFKSLKELYGGQIAETNEGVSFPKELSPPVMKIKKGKGPLKEGDLYNLSVEIKWPGDSRRYLIKVPRMTLPKGIELQKVWSSSIQKNGHSILEYHYPLIVREAGSYRLGPLELSYKPRVGGLEQFSRHPGFDLVVKKAWGKIQWGSLIGGILCLIGLISLYIFKKRKTKKNSTSLKAPYFFMNEDLLFSLKKMKIEGKQRDYTQNLIEWNKKLSIEKGLDGKEEEELLQLHKYGGAKIDDLKMRFFERRLEDEIKKEEL
jgi:peroxiredoxin